MAVDVVHLLNNFFSDFPASVFVLAILVALSTAVLGGFTVNWYSLRTFFPFSSNLVDPESKKHGGDLVAEVLKAHNVTSIFTLTGGHISPILVGAEKAGIRVVDTRHEVTAAFAADAYARLSGNIGVAVVTAGPGVTNVVTAIKNAQMAESPVLLLGGAAATLLKGRGSLQDIDQLSLFQSVCKFCVSVSYVREIIPTLCKAIQIAMSGVPGPVFVELPLDVLYPYHLVKREVQGKKGTGGFMARITDWYLNWYLRNLFANGFTSQEVRSLPIKVPTASASDVKKTQKMIMEAKRPVFIVGSQAVFPAPRAMEVQHALYALGIPCYLSGMARGLLGQKHTLLMRQNRKQALKEADLIILAGAVCDFRLSYGKGLSKKAKVISINLSKEQLFKNSDIFWKPALAVNGSVCDFLIQLKEALVDHFCDPKWLECLQKREAEKEKENLDMRKELNDKYLNPVDLLFYLESILPEKTILVADGGDFVATASYILRPRGPLKWLDPGPFGTLGVGAGFAMGAKLLLPDHNVVIIYGDGSVGFSLMEFDSFYRHRLPVIAVVGNDACWSQIEREQVPMFNSDIACKLRFTRYERVAESLGAHGVKLDGKDKEELTALLNFAVLNSHEAHKSLLINAFIFKSNFRAGSISV